MQMKKIALLTIMTLAMQFAYGQAIYEKTIELQGGPGIDKHTKFSVGASTTHGARIDNFFIGAGAGFRYTNALYYSSYGLGTSNSYDGKYLIPLYIRASYQFGNSSVKPMLSFDLGTTIDVGQNQQYKNTEGLFYEPAVGVSIAIDEKTSIFMTLGLNYQNAHHTFYSYGSSTSTEEIKGMGGTLNFKFGLTF